MSQAIPAHPTADAPTRRVHRVEVWMRDDEIDPAGDAVRTEARQRLGDVESVRAARIYLIEAPLDDTQHRRIADELLADAVSQRAVLGTVDAPTRGALLEVHYQPGVMDPVAQSTRDAILEMLPDLVRDHVQVRTGFRYDLHASQAHDAPFHDEALRTFAEQVLANPVIQDIHTQPFWPDAFPQGGAYALHLTHVPIRELDDAGLERLSREGHLFLSLAEMQAIQRYYRDKAQREPTDIELETLAQTWSEHCVHKTLKSTIHYTPHASTAPPRTDADAERSEAPDHRCDSDTDPLAIFRDAHGAAKPGHEIHDDGSVTIHNLLKSTVAAATHALMQDAPHNDWCVSVFEDNAGIVKLDDADGIAIKVETHNHPSAIEPYGGAATGIGGCIRDVIGTGLAARPIANTDVFCVADPNADWQPQDGESRMANGESQHNDTDIVAKPENQHSKSATLPKGVIHPKRILQQVVAGVRDYGNRMGIPTVNGAVWCHDAFIGNPLVFAGCVGIVPLDKAFGEARDGDRIIALGGATGRDGIHGATFSSAELTDTHADEFSHAVQIGNAITERKMMDVILQARDHEPSGGAALFNAITDCGAGGFSSAIGEMGERTGAHVTLESAPLKYTGLSYTEIWISEAQERMVLAVPPDKVDPLRALCDAEDVGFCDLGRFGCHDDENPDAPVLTLTYEGEQVGRLEMGFLHHGLPTPTRRAEWPTTSAGQNPAPEITTSSRRPLDPRRASLDETLHALLAHPNIASKHWIIRQYDHEVQGASTIKPLVGPEQDGPSDAAVLRPKLDSERGITLSGGMAPHLSEKASAIGDALDGDSYWATLAAIDEAVRNSVCVGTDPQRIALLDNFCWPNCDDPKQMGTLVRAAEACHDGALAYRAPFISGKDSLSNQFTTDEGTLITIPQTLLITALGIVDDVKQCATMDAKSPGDALLIVGRTDSTLGGSHYRMITGDDTRNSHIPRTDLALGPRTAQTIAPLVADGHASAAHDCSDGGLLVAAAEMAFAGRLGLDLDLAALPTDRELDAITACFAETPSRYLLAVSPDRLDPVINALRDAALPFAQIGTFADHDRLTLRTPRDGRVLNSSIESLHRAWQAPLDW